MSAVLRMRKQEEFPAPWESFRALAAATLNLLGQLAALAAGSGIAGTTVRWTPVWPSRAQSERLMGHPGAG